MSNHLKSYKQYPPGTLLVTKSYGLFERFWYWLKRKRRPYNVICILPSFAHISMSKYEMWVHDFFVFVPKKPYNKKEQKLLKELVAGCETARDYLTAINVVRPNTVDETADLDQLKNNPYYTKYWLDEEPFSNV